MNRKITIAALFLALLIVAGCRLANCGKDVILAAATSTVLMTLDATAGKTEQPARALRRPLVLPANAECDRELTPTVRG